LQMFVTNHLQSP